MVSFDSSDITQKISRKNLKETEFNAVLENCLRDFPQVKVKVLRKEQKACLLNLARRKDVFAILPTGFGKSLIFQLFPRVSSALLSSEVKPLSTIIVVSPLVSVMRDQVEQLKQLGFSAAAIGIGDECITNAIALESKRQQ